MKGINMNKEQFENMLKQPHAWLVKSEIRSRVFHDEEEFKKEVARLTLLKVKFEAYQVW